MPIKLLSTDQLRAADRFTIEHEPIASYALMERAAKACTHWIIDHYRPDQTFLFFCGTRNNGGDGLAIARLLSENGYSSISIYIVGEAETGSSDFQLNLELLKGFKLHPLNLREKADIPVITPKTVVVDALFGSGLTRSVSGLFLEVIQKINCTGNEVISIDIPSGMFGEDNRSNPSEGIISATHTLTFQQPKIAFLLADVGEKCGSWHILDIGLSEEFINRSASDLYLTTSYDVEAIHVERNKFAHKGTFGHCLIIAGSKGMMGAAVLATRSALRSGAGLVSAMVPGCGYSILQTTAPEAMCVSCVTENSISGSADWSSFDAVGIGPGLGKDPGTLATLTELLTTYKGYKVIDADALNLLAENKSLLKLLDDKTVLTPHPGEFDRLFGKSPSSYERLLLLQKRSKELNCYILLKGAYTAIATPGGELHFNNTGNPGMAKGGSGDVLTGYMTGLVSVLKSPIDASVFAVWNHGKIGDMVAGELGEEQMTALDLANRLS